MPKLVCIDCKIKMVVYKAGAYAIEYTDPEMTKLYKLWMVDVWHCPKCFFRLIGAIAQKPLRMHFQKEPTITEMVAEAKTTDRIILEFY